MWYKKISWFEIIVTPFSGHVQITVTGLLKIEISYEKQEDKTLKTLGFSVQTNLSSS